MESLRRTLASLRKRCLDPKVSNQENTTIYYVHVLTVTIRTTACKYMQVDQLAIHYNVLELVLKCSF